LILLIKNIINHALQKPLWAFVIIALVFLLGLIPPFFLGVGEYWDNYKLVLMTFVPVVYFVTCFIKQQKNIVNLPFYTIDICWLLFLGLCFFSFNWATNSALILHPAFGWMTLILWIFLIRHLVNKEQVKEQKLFADILMLTFLAVAFHILVILSTGQLTILERWNSHFGNTSNYTSAFLLGLSAFLLFYSNTNKWLWVLKIISLVFVFMIIQKANAKGSVITFVIVLFYFLWTFLPKKLVKQLLAIGTILIIVITASFIYLNFEIFQQLGDVTLQEAGASHRLYALKSSLSMFRHAPILGQGLGNWFEYAYVEDLSETIGFNHPTYHIRLGTHNLFELILVELGLLGFLCFFTPFFFIIVKALLFSYKYDALQKAAVTTILIYLCTAIFYKDVNLYEAHFSGLQLLTFVSLGLLFQQQKKYYLPFKAISGILAVLGLIVLLWFSYYILVDKKYNKAIANLNRAPNAELLDDYLFSSYFDDKQQPVDNLKETTQLMETVYHPSFKTTHGFYGGGRGANRLIPLHLAQLYQRQEKYDLTEIYYQQSLQIAPNDELVLKSYARFLLRVRKDYAKAKTFALKAYVIQQNNFYCNILLGEIAIRENDYKTARKYLELVEKHPMDYGFKNLTFILLSELALAEEATDKAKEYLDKVNSSNYIKQKEKLQTLIDQANKSAN